MPSFLYNTQKETTPTTTLSKTTSLKGVLRFDGIVCVMGRFNGTIEAKGDLVVGKGANVECDHIYVNSITVHGLVAAQIRAKDKVDLMQGSEVRGDIRAGRLRIADGVLFEGNCSMIDGDGDVEIFSLSTPEIKATLRPDVYSVRDEYQEAAENAPESPDTPDMTDDGAEASPDSV